MEIYCCFRYKLGHVLVVTSKCLHILNYVARKFTGFPSFTVWITEQTVTCDLYGSRKYAQKHLVENECGENL